MLITHFLFNSASLILKKTAGFWTDDEALEGELCEEAGLYMGTENWSFRDLRNLVITVKIKKNPDKQTLAYQIS